MGIFDKNSFKGSNDRKWAGDVVDGILFVLTGAWLIKMFRRRK